MIRPRNLVLVWHNNAAYLAIKVPICRIRFVILESSSNLTWHLGLHHENCHGKTTTWRSMTLSENLNAPGLGVRMALGAMTTQGGLFGGSGWLPPPSGEPAPLPENGR